MQLRTLPVFLIIFLFPRVMLLSQSLGQDIISPFRKAPERDIKYPSKDKRMIYPDTLVLLAKDNISRYTSAKSLQKTILKRADYWLEFTGEELSHLITEASVPRAFDLSTVGCPVHGDSVFKARGAYPWIIDPKHPFHVKCPIDGEVFPSNDYAAYYSSGFTEKKGWDTQYVDDGWGWLSPQGDRYWFVAYANQEMWRSYISPGLLVLGQAYLLTGDKQYASQAIDMLYRIASVYPSMDHENQSRYGMLMKQRNTRYPGKILNRIWETNMIKNFAEVYDMVWVQIDREMELQQRTGKTGEEIRAFIEANLLEEGLDAIQQEKILGNFGMHQNALVALHLSRQHAGRDKAMDRMLNEPSPRVATNGLRYALYNQIGRDGIPFESPGYNNIWVVSLTDIAETLLKDNINLFSEFRLKKMLDAPLDMVAIGLYTPDCGDGGSVLGGITGKNNDTYHIAYNYYKDARYLNWLKLPEGKIFSSFRALFREPLPSVPDTVKTDRVLPPQSSRLFAGYGLGILNNRADNTAVSFTYGMHYSHYHWDFLNIEIFANGQKMMPDLGYPDAMNNYVQGIYTWSQNTISHNTVVVDEKRQERNLPGVLHGFVDGTFARAMDASSSAYLKTKVYRRNIVMIDTEDSQSYFVDFFHVEGGNRHDYSLHGPPGQIYSPGSTWSDTLTGSFAGNYIKTGTIYDNKNLQEQGDKIGYAGYRGSGFQHLFNVQRLESGNGMLEYRHLHDEDARLRIQLLPDDVQEVSIADAYNKPRSKEHLLKYLIATRKSEKGDSLHSIFVSILEPYKGDSPFIRSAQLTKPEQGNGQVVVVDRGTLRDVIIHDPVESAKVLSGFDIQTDAATMVATFKQGELVRVFYSGGSYFYSGKKKFFAKEVRGKVVKVDASNRVFQVKPNKKMKYPFKTFSGYVAFFTNPYRTTVHPLQNVKMNNGILEITTWDDLLVGRLRVDNLEKNRLTTKTTFTFAPYYMGTTLLDKNLSQIGLLTSLENGGTLVMEESSSLTSLEVGDEAWLSNIGVGDEFLIRSSFEWEK